MDDYTIDSESSIENCASENGATSSESLSADMDETLSTENSIWIYTDDFDDIHDQNVIDLATPLGSAAACIPYGGIDTGSLARCRLLSAKAGVQAPPDVNSIKIALSFLKRSIADQNPNTSPTHLINRIRLAVIEMDQERPARTKRIIGLRCSATEKPIPRTNWKDVNQLKSLLNVARKHKSTFINTDSNEDRLGELKRVITSYYARRYGLNEDKLTAYVADTGSHYEKIHPAKIGFIALTALSKRGQSVLLPLPDYGQQSEWLEVFQFTNGIKPDYYKLNPDYAWRLDLNELDDAIDSNIGAFFLCNPAFMCGGVITEREMQCLVQLLSKKNIPLVVNEMLDYLVYEQDKSMHSPLEFKPTIPVVIINSSNRWMTFGAQGLPLAWALVYDPRGELPHTVSTALQGIEPTDLQLPKPSSLAATLYHTRWPGDICRYLAINSSIAMGILKRTPGIRVIEPKASYFVVCMLDLNKDECRDAFGGQFKDDVDFAKALFKEESVKVFCGSIVLGWPNCFAIDMYVRRNLLLAQCQRMDEFCRRHIDPNFGDYVMIV